MVYSQPIHDRRAVSVSRSSASPLSACRWTCFRRSAFPVVVATFFSGMPPEQIETDITGRFERFFTLAAAWTTSSRARCRASASSRSTSSPDSMPIAATSIANLAMADLRKLPPGTLPPVVLKFDASSLPVCLVTLKGAGLNEAKLRDLGQYDVRNQIANVPGASVPQPFGGTYRQIMVYVDPLKLEAHQLSVMDVVRTVNEANLILPAGDVKIGPLRLQPLRQQPDRRDRGHQPPAAEDRGQCLGAGVRMSARPRTRAQIQNNIVRVDGQPSVYLPVLKQGGDANTIAVVDGIKERCRNLLDVPKQLVARSCSTSRCSCSSAIENLIHEGAIGLVLTGADDPGIPRQHARDRGGVSVDPAVGAGGVHRAVVRRQHHQRHDSGRPGAGVLAPDRQLRGGAGEHLPSHGDRRDAAKSRRSGAARKSRCRCWRRR